MDSYKKLVEKLEEAKYLISMTPIERMVEIGYSAGMASGSTVLDLCCGYGEMRKVWHEAFGIRGVGVDNCGEFIRERARRTPCRTSNFCEIFAKTPSNFTFSVL